MEPRASSTVWLHKGDMVTATNILCGQDTFLPVRLECASHHLEVPTPAPSLPPPPRPSLPASLSTRSNNAHSHAAASALQLHDLPAHSCWGPRFPGEELRAWIGGVVPLL